MSRSRHCLAPTRRGGLCQNYLATCPIAAHRRPRTTKPAGIGTARSAWQHVDGGGAAAPPTPLAENVPQFQKAVNDASNHYGIAPQLIIGDYWLVRTLYAWVTAVGDDTLQRAYPDPAHPTSEQRVGRVVFGGGTALSTAWGITERWSQDIDLILDPSDQAKPRHLQQACKSAFGAVAKRLDGSYRITDKGPGHCFASFIDRQRGEISSIDIAFEALDIAPLWTQKMPVMSMIGRMNSDEMRDAHPELGGFDFDVLGPGSTAMNKLLAQTRTSESGDMAQISGRARDVYDLACIANQAARFEGHIGRDSKALLHIAERWMGEGDPGRPLDGFASLRSFDPGTREYEALAEGYETVMRDMVWGDTIPLDEAISLAVSLDSGAAEPPSPPEPNPLVAHPRR